ncbi:MAG: DUF354 domain-containing protein [Acidobacteriia bacterium]|nr:DUF354 domain-containing protein [Terriglobia bacterium]
MNIWIDLANSPQVLFFRPIISHLRSLGHELVITTRHYAQTVELADVFALNHTPLGGHGGRSRSRAVWSNWERSNELRRFVSGRKISMALSHNSYSQILAAWRMGIPAVTATDYEHNPLNHLAFRLATRVIVPQAFPQGMLQRFGAGSKKVRRYSGIKEQIYLQDFEPEKDYAARLGLPRDKVLVVLRPPADWTVYHPKRNKLMDRLMEFLSADPNTFVVFLPRIPDQRSMIDPWKGMNVWIPDSAVDGPNLIWAADLVISAGGTMNREAAVLGTPSYTIFAGRLAGVDEFLLNKGRMKVIQNVEDFPPLRRSGEKHDRLKGENLLSELTLMMLEAAQGSTGKH